MPTIWLCNMNYSLCKKIACLLILSVAVGGLQNWKLNSFKDEYTRQTNELRSDINILNIIKNSPTVGFKNIFSNYTFLKFLQYFGNEKERKNTGYVLSSNYFETILSHDPFYKNYYLFLSGSTTIYAGNPEASVALMAENLKSFRPQKPNDSYYIWRYKAVDELLFVGDSEAAQNSFEMAAKWGEESTDPNAALLSKDSQQTAQFLATNPDSHQAQINAWSSILTTAIDNKTQQRAVARIRQLGGDITVSEDGRVRVSYTAKNKIASEKEEPNK